MDLHTLPLGPLGPAGPRPSLIVHRFVPGCFKSVQRSRAFTRLTADLRVGRTCTLPPWVHWDEQASAPPLLYNVLYQGGLNIQRFVPGCFKTVPRSSAYTRLTADLRVGWTCTHSPWFDWDQQVRALPLLYTVFYQGV